MFGSVWIWFGKQNFDGLVLFGSGRTVKHCLGRSLLTDSICVQLQNYLDPIEIAEDEANGRGGGHNWHQLLSLVLVLATITLHSVLELLLNQNKKSLLSETTQPGMEIHTISSAMQGISLQILRHHLGDQRSLI